MNSPMMPLTPPSSMSEQQQQPQQPQLPYENGYNYDDIPPLSSSSSAATTMAEVVPYDTGFVFFLTMTLLLGATIAIHWSSWIRRNDILRYANHPNNQYVLNGYYGSWCRHVCNMLNIVALEICIAFLVYSSIHGPISDFTEIVKYEQEGMVSNNNENNHDGFSFIDIIQNGRIGLLIATITMWIPLLFVSSFLLNKQSIRRVILLISTLFLVIPGCVIITFVCQQLNTLQAYTYHGPMRITNVSVSFTNHTTQFFHNDAILRNRDTTTTAGANSYDPYQLSANIFYYHGAIQVSWGEDWGCPGSAEETWCDALIYHKPCSYCQIKGGNGQSCHEVGYQHGTYDDTKQCIIKEYNLGVISDFDIMDLSKYDMILNQHKTFGNSVKPMDDKDWPNEIFYGDCNTCKARTVSSFDIQSNYIARLQGLGVLLTCSGVIIHAVLMLWQSIQPITNKLLSLFTSVEDDDDNNNNNNNNDNNDNNDTNVSNENARTIEAPTLRPDASPSSPASTSDNDQDIHNSFEPEIEV